MLEFIELYKHLSPPPQKPKKQSGKSKGIRHSGAYRISIPRLPLTMRVARSVFWIDALLLLSAISITLGGILALIGSNAASTPPTIRRSPPAQTLNPFVQSELSRSVNILVIGVDGTAEALDTGDFLLLMHFDPFENSVSALTIPGDTRVEIPGRGRNALKQAHSIGGVTLTSQAIGSILNSVTIDRYVRINRDSFRQLVDLLDGVEIFVPYPIPALDAIAQGEINLQPGWQRLKGQQALGFAAVKDPDGNFGELQRQQMLLKALRDRLASPSLSAQLPRIVRLMHEYLDTNLSLEEAQALVNLLLTRSPQGFKMVLLPGEFSTPRKSKIRYWSLDPKGRDRVMRSYFDLESAPSTQRDRLAVGSPNTLRIAIQNASENPLVLGKMIRFLKQNGFKNVYPIADWPEGQSQTQIIIQKGDVDAASALQNLLNLGQLEASSIGDLDSDLTVRIGEDWIDSQDSDLVE